jgi:PAS domain S-box-containing protein
MEDKERQSRLVEQMEREKEILFKLTEATNISVNLEDFFHKIHLIFKENYSAENFYVALYDENIPLISFPYFSDRFDQPPKTQKPGRGLTEHVIHNGKTLLLNGDTLERMAKQENLELHGRQATSWLGVPLKSSQRTIGMFAVQKYSGEQPVGEDQKKMFELVARLIAMAIVRIEREEALARNEYKYRRMLNDSLVGIYIIQQGKLKFCNWKFAMIFGFDNPAQALQVPVSSMVAEDSREKVRYELELRESGQKMSSHYEFKAQKTDGTTFDVEVLGSRIEYMGAPAVQGTIVDITERKRMLDSLKASEAKFRNLVDQSPLAIQILDMEGNQLSANKAWQKMWGLNQKEEINRFNIFSHPSMQQSELLPYLKRIFKGETPPLPILKFKSADGRHGDLYLRTYYYPIKDSEGISRNMVILQEDLTKIKRAEDAIKDIVAGGYSRSGDEFFRTMVKQLAKTLNADYTFIGELEKGKSDSITTLAFFAGGKPCKNFKYSLRGTPCQNVVGQKICSYPSGIATLFPADRMLKKMEVEGYVGVPLFDSRDKPVGIIVALFKKPLKEVGFAESVLQIFAARTAGEIERMHLDIRREKLEEQLRQAQKMEALGTLAGGIAHDFNNILSAIYGYSELTLSALDQDSKEHSNLQQVIAASDRAREMVQQILTFSRKKEKGQKTVLLGNIVKEVLKLLQSILPSTIELKTDIADTDRPVLADPTEIHQIIMNMCTNAIQAMEEEGGTLSISLRKTGHPPGHAAQLPKNEAGYLEMTIQDTGVGIPQDIKHRIFDPYFTTKEKGQGTGLGLSVVHGIIQAHNGDILVDSTPGLGTTFTIYLPGLQSEKLPDHKMEGIIPGKKEWILFVDDEKSLTQLANQMLPKIGYNVVTCNSGNEALDVFSRNPDRFKLVISDDIMPKLSGIQLANKLKAIRKDIPILLCTGYSKRISEPLENIGIDGYILKPLTSNELSRAIDKLLRKEKNAVAPT